MLKHDLIISYSEKAKYYLDLAEKENDFNKKLNFIINSTFYENLICYQLKNPIFKDLSNTEIYAISKLMVFLQLKLLKDIDSVNLINIKLKKIQDDFLNLLENIKNIYFSEEF